MAKTSMNKKENQSVIPKSTEKILQKDPYINDIVVIDKKNPSRFICLVCTDNQAKIKKKDNVSIGGKFKWLKQHLSTPTHRSFTPETDLRKLEQAIKSLGRKTQTQESYEEKEEGSSIDLDEKLSETIEDFPLSKDNEARLYLDLAQMITKNHLPFKIAETLLQFLKDMAAKYPPRLIERAHISSTTITKIIKECVGGILKKDIFEQMKKMAFSILTDQSSDVYGDKYLALLIRYIDYVQEKPITKLLAIIEIERAST